MTVTEVAQLLGLSRDSVYDGAGRGQIPCIRIGKRLIFPRAAILEWHRTAAGAVPLPVTSEA